ncbi:ABC transporter substrate-binding protein [Rubrobacter tropicus]|nr:sugar ABC transporter substrate-binding protein [Rubrobacter tropicus]
MERAGGRFTRRDFLRLGGAGVAGASLLGLYGCGGGGSSGAQIDWASWANSGEATRFREYTDKFMQDHPDIQVTYTPTPIYDDYHPKILTQLNGGTAPDAFYAGDIWVAQFIKNETIKPLNKLMNGPNSAAKPEDFADGLWGPARLDDGTIYGVTVDCNPTVLWYNKGVLEEAGISDDPRQIYESGEWKWDVLLQMSEQVASSGNTNGLMFENGINWFYSWCRQNGGKPFDGETCVFNEDAKSVEAFQWMYDNIESGAFTYAGNLPTGQTSDAQFNSNRAAFVQAGRWVLPVFKQNTSLEYDVVPFPTNTDNDMEPGWVATAYMVMNNQTENEKAAFEFLTNFTGPEGQSFRLQESGNAVPSVLQGADDLVTKGSDPEGSQYFLDVRDSGIVGYADLTVPGLPEDIQDLFEKELWLKNAPGDVQATLDGAAQTINQRIEENRNG